MSENVKENFDSVLCFGGADWWYHNKGHFDMKIMREISKEKKVVYVNSIGMRVPKIEKDKAALKKIKRKIKSMVKGVVEVENNFWVYSPIYLPSQKYKFLSDFLLKLQVFYVCKKAGLKKPLYWFVTPTAINIFENKLQKETVVYQRTDRNEDFKEGDYDYIKKSVDKLRDRADLTIYSSKVLHEEEMHLCNESAYISHGLADVFLNKAIIKNNPMTQDNGKKVLFVGAIDEHTFDVDLLIKCLDSYPEVNFYLVGDVMIDIPSDRKNVKLLGRKEQEEVPSYLQQADVLAMFWQRNEWIKYCSPIKYKEYLTTGKPIVTIDFEEINFLSHGGVYGAKGVDDFLDNLGLALNDDNKYFFDASNEGWGDKLKQVKECIAG